MFAISLNCRHVPSLELNGDNCSIAASAPMSSTPGSPSFHVGTFLASPRSMRHAHISLPHHRSKPESRIALPPQSVVPSCDSAATMRMDEAMSERMGPQKLYVKANAPRWPPLA